jgi:hypothetical protein
MERSVTEYLKPTKTQKSGCCNCADCHAKTQGLLPVTSAVAIVQSMKDSGKISNCTDFDNISAKLGNHVPSVCKPNYERQIEQMRPEVQIDDACAAETAKMAKILQIDNQQGCGY